MQRLGMRHTFPVLLHWRSNQIGSGAPGLLRAHHNWRSDFHSTPLLPDMYSGRFLPYLPIPLCSLSFSSYVYTAKTLRHPAKMLEAEY